MRALALATLLSLLSTSVRADDARELFEDGTAAIHAGGYDRAVQLLERSLELRARAATAFNLVLALRLARRLLRAEALCVQLRAGEFGALEGERRERVEGECRTVSARVPQLRVRVRFVGGSGTARLQLDGGLAAMVEGPDEVVLRVDPGEHVVQLSGPPAIGESASVTLDVGETRTLELTLRGSPTTANDDEDRRRRRRRGWGIGLGVVAAGILAGVLGAALRPDPGPTPGDLGPAGT